MEYKESLLYIQRQIDALLRSFRVFICVFVNDIIIFNKIF